jgi:hypothetical protein
VPARAHAGRARRVDAGELHRVDGAVAQHIELAAVEPRAEADRAGVEHDLLGRVRVGGVDLAPATVGQQGQGDRHQRVQATRGALRVDGDLRGGAGFDCAITARLNGAAVADRGGR